VILLESPLEHATTAAPGLEAAGDVLRLSKLRSIGVAQIERKCAHELPAWIG
jgi:hypothetical protein